MQRLELSLLVLAVLAALVAAGLLAGRRRPHGHLAVQLGLGLAIGAAAALVVLVSSVDLVPDDMEAGPWITLLGAFGLLGIGGLILRVARH